MTCNTKPWWQSGGLCLVPRRPDGVLSQCQLYDVDLVIFLETVF